MGLTARDLFYSQTDADGTWGVDVRKIVLTDPALNTTTRTNHGNAETLQTRVVDPFNNNTLSGLAAPDYGFAINLTGADGMESTATEKRVIPAGLWEFRQQIGVPAPSGVGGTITVQPRFYVYRVLANGTRSLLFSGVAPTQQTTLLTGAQTFTYDWSSTRPEYVMEAGETIQVSLEGLSTQVVGTLGTAVSVFLTWSFGGGAAYTRLPTPGVRTQYVRSYDSTLTSSGALQRKANRSWSGATTPVGNLTKRSTATLGGAITPAAALTKKIIRNTPFAGSIGPTGVLRKQVNRRFTGTIIPAATVRTLLNKVLTGTITPAGAASFRLFIVRSGSIAPAGTVTKRVSKFFEGFFYSTGSGGPAPVIRKIQSIIFED